MQYPEEFALKSVLNTDSFDRRTYGELRACSRTLQESETNGTNDFPTYPHLQGDVWSGLFKMDPQMTEKQPTGVEVNKEIMERVLKNDQFQSLREFTKLDELSSALGCVQMANELKNIIANKDVKENQQEADKANQKAEQAQSAAEMLKDAAEMAQDEKAKKDLLNRAKQKLKDARKAKKEAQKATEKVVRTIKQQLDGKEGQEQLKAAIARTDSNTKEGTKEVNNIVSSFGYGTQPGEKEQVSAKDKIALAEAISSNPKLKKIAKYLGRMSKIAMKKQKEKRPENPVLGDVNFGQDIPNVLPEELALLQKQGTKREFYRKFTEEQLLQFDPAKVKLGRGPIVCCLDTSGSMRSLDEEAKALALSLLMIARKQKRAFAMVNFSSASQCKEWVFSRSQKIKPVDIVEVAEYFWAGGTDFQTPLTSSMKIIKNDKFQRADIVFITDGKAGFTEVFEKEFQVFKKAKKVSVVSIQLGGQETEILKKFSDKIINASSFFDDSVSEVFEI